MSALGRIEAAAPSWMELRVALEKAQAAETAYDTSVYADAIAAAKAQGTALDDRLTDLSDMLTDARVAAEEAMAFTPSPDLGATLYKIEYARTRWRDCEDWPDSWWAAVLSDLRRFAGADAAISLVATGPCPKSGGSKPAEWRQAEGWYRAIAGVKVDDMPEAVSEAVDVAVCAAMRHLIEKVTPPGAMALILKMELIRDFVGDAMPAEWWDVLEADVAQLVISSEVVA